MNVPALKREHVASHLQVSSPLPLLCCVMKIPCSDVLEINLSKCLMSSLFEHSQKYKDYQKKRSEAEHDPYMINKTGKMWSSSFLSHEALLGYGQSKLLTNPGN